MESPAGEFSPPARILLGPGPSNVHPRVLRAMTAPLLGYLDPDFLRVMDGVTALLQRVFGTANNFTLAVSATGSGGMEAGVANLLEPGDLAVIGTHGFFGERMAEIASRHGAQVCTVPSEWGRPLDPSDVEKELKKHPKVKVLGVVHAETSTGVLQPLEEMARLARQYEALLLVDAVTSLGGSPVEVDRVGIDFCFSAAQKCLGAPPGLAPATVGPRGIQAIQGRKGKPHTWYLDLGLLRQYWEATKTRVYHHTAPAPLIYALREALRIVLEEGLEARYARHRRNGRALREGLEALGLRLLVPEEHCTYQLTTVLVPDGVDQEKVRDALRVGYNIEIGGGLAKFRGRMWRIGLMGESSTAANVLYLLSALEALLPRFGYEVPVGAGVAAASRVLAEAR